MRGSLPEVWVVPSLLRPAPLRLPDHACPPMPAPVADSAPARACWQVPARPCRPTTAESAPASRTLQSRYTTPMVLQCSSSDSTAFMTGRTCRGRRLSRGGGGGGGGGVRV
eukprot:281715-Chlamydomonas_euryale.AAC.2